MRLELLLNAPVACTADVLVSAGFGDIFEPFCESAYVGSMRISEGEG